MSQLELPHELLLRKYGLNSNQLSSHTQQLKRDLDKTLTLIVNKSRNGQIQISPSTQSKIETYDRYICDGIFEFLENEDVITEGQADSIESQMDSKRDEVVNNLNTTSTPSTPSTSSTTEEKTSQSENSGIAKIGFWDWQ
jgi:hypothetical protein